LRGATHSSVDLALRRNHRPCMCRCSAACSRPGFVRCRMR